MIRITPDKIEVSGTLEPWRMTVEVATDRGAYVLTLDLLPGERENIETTVRNATMRAMMALGQEVG